MKKKFGFFLSLVLSGAAALFGQNNLDSALVAYYKFSGDALDVSGNANHGALLGGVTVDSSLVISVQRLSLPHTILNGLTDFTIYARLKIDRVNTENGNTWISGARVGQPNALFVWYRATEKHWEIQVNSKIATFAVDSTVEDLQWHSIVVTRRDSTAFLFIDGLQIRDSVFVAPDTLKLNAGGFIVGQDQDVFGDSFEANQSWEGRMDNLRIFNRALSKAEIQIVGPQNVVNGLLAYYPFEGNAEDASGNGNHGELLGGASVGNSLRIVENGLDRMLVPNTVFNGLSDFTIAAKLKINLFHLEAPTGITRLPFNTWISGSSNLASNALTVVYSASDDAWLLFVNNNRFYFPGAAIMEDSGWHSAAIVREGAIGKLYIDANKVGEDVAVPDTTLQVDLSVIIGQDQDRDGGLDPWQSWDGEIDEFRVYARALKASEIEDLITSVKTPASPKPSRFRLLQNYPNPFNPVTRIDYEITDTGSVDIIIFNTLGQKVRTLFKQSNVAPGNYSVTWDGKNDSGGIVSSGIYLYQVRVNGFALTRKAIFMK